MKTISIEDSPLVFFYLADVMTAQKIKIAAAISFHKEFESSYVMLRYWISATCTQLMPCSTSEPQCTEQQYGVKVLWDVVEL